MIAMPGQSKRQKRGTDAVKHSSGNAQRDFHKRKAEKSRRQGIELLRVAVGILPCEKILGRLNGPAEVSRALVKMSQQEPAENSTGESDGGGDPNARSHEG